MTNEELSFQLNELVDPQYKDFHQGLCPGKSNILGIRIPRLRSFAKELLKEYSPEEILDSISFSSAEEIMLYGFILSLIKAAPEDRLPFLQIYIAHIDSWATCDYPVAAMKFIQKDRPFFWSYLCPLLHAEEPYTVRFAVVAMLDHFMIPEYIPLLLPLLESVSHEDYYVKMAVAWAISICFIKEPHLTLTFLKKTTLDTFTYNKSIQKICESYRVDPQTKAVLKAMKR